MLEIGDKMNANRLSTYSEKSTDHVTYIMTSSFRVLDNHSLFYAINTYKTCNIIIYRRLENKRQNDYFDAFVFNLINTLKQFGDVSIVYTVKDIKIDNDVVIDKGYLKEEKETEEYIKQISSYPITIIESNVSVPVTFVSQKEEYSARTIRPKIHKILNNFIDPVMEEYKISSFEKKALKDLNDFIDNKLKNYHLKNHPENEYTSNISTYLKYGIISPIRILLLLEDNRLQNKEVFIEELIVRRELAFNFVYYNEQYYNFKYITYEWAYLTMSLHQFDPKEYLYTVDDYINFRTHDKYFNTAMKEMVYLGKMHGYMRMYWCKKIIEWSSTFKEAYETSIFLNNKYFFDGNTPNGYTGVAWCFGKHDRAWTERLIFGKLRYMNSNGLKRKFDIEKYVEKIEKEVRKYESSKT